MILGIESSCDDSSVAVLGLGYEIKYYKKITQESEHSKYGGVVPELASRLHTAALPDLIAGAKPFFKSLKAIAVTNEPGLSVSLVGGVSVAKSLAMALNLPLISVNHLVGHIYSLFLDRDILLPLGILLVSGGHTMVLNIDSCGKIEILAVSGDDSFGESFDKVAKMMGLGYPGGEVVERLARDGAPSYDFTIPLKGNKRLEYSFSGLKNQVRLAVQSAKKSDFANIAASFQEVACEHIIDKLSKICQKCSFASLGVVGGASANGVLRAKLEELCSKVGINLITAPLKYCSDNALMIARAGLEKYRLGRFIEPQNLSISPRCLPSSIYL